MIQSIKEQQSDLRYLKKCYKTKQFPCGTKILGLEQLAESIKLCELELAQSKILIHIKEFAVDNYENGWDVFVEAYTDNEFLEFFKDSNVVTYKDAKKACLEYIELINQRETEVW